MGVLKRVLIRESNMTPDSTDNSDISIRSTCAHVRGSAVRPLLCSGIHLPDTWLDQRESAS